MAISTHLDGLGGLEAAAELLVGQEGQLCVRRVEVMVPITNKTVHDQVLGQVMLANILDTEQSWQLDPDGQYHRLRQGDGGFNCHQYFMANPSLSGRGAALAEHEVPRLTLRGADA